MQDSTVSDISREGPKVNLHSEDYAPRLGLPIMLAFTKLNKPMFGGVTDEVWLNRVVPRRAKNKAARKSRRINRLRGAK